MRRVPCLYSSPEQAGTQDCLWCTVPTLRRAPKWKHSFIHVPAFSLRANLLYLTAGGSFIFNGINSFIQLSAPTLCSFPCLMSSTNPKRNIKYDGGEKKGKPPTRARLSIPESPFVMVDKSVM